MKKRLLLSLFLQTVIVAVLLVPTGCEKSEQSQLPPPEVEVVQIEQKDVPISKEWVGTLDGLVNAQIRPQVTGYLLRQTLSRGLFCGNRPVKVGERIGTQWIVDEGLKPGDRVVAEGVQRVSAGMTVNPKPFTAMSEAKPTPTAKPEPR